jgi:hypothetical protein
MENPLPDGRYLCKVCVGMAMKHGDDMEPIIKNVVHWLNTVGFSDLRIEDITVEIVTAQKMAELSKTFVINVMNKGFVLSNVSAGFLGGKTFKHSIYLLTHQNKVELAGALAHEMLHAWLVQNGVKMSPKLTEGFCNMGSWLLWNRLSSSLTEIYLKELRNNPDPIYGDGFREIFAMYEEWEWEGLIKMVKDKFSS